MDTDDKLTFYLDIQLVYLPSIFLKVIIHPPMLELCSCYPTMADRHACTTDPTRLYIIIFLHKPRIWNFICKLINVYCVYKQKDFMFHIEIANLGGG